MSADDEPRPRSGGLLPLFGISFLAAAIATTGFVLSFMDGYTGAAFLTVAAACTALVSSKWDPATPPAFALTCAASAGWLTLSAAARLDPIVESGFKCGTAEAALMAIGMPFVFVSAAVGFAILRKVIGFLPRAVDVFGRWGFRVGWLAGLALLVGGVQHRMRVPEPDGFLERLPIVAEVSAPSTLPCKPIKDPAGHDACEPVSVEAGPVQATVKCSPTDGGACLVGVSPKFTDPDVPIPASDIYVGRDQAIRIRRDEAMKLYFVESAGRSERAIRDDGSLVFFVPPSAVADEVGAPTAWLVLGGVGLALALGAAVLGRLRERRADELARARAGRLLASGWIELADGSLPTFSGETGPAGVVAVLDAPSPGGYRSAPKADAIRFERGSPSELGDLSRRAASSAYVAAVAALLLSFAPIIAALRLGLLA